MNFKQNLFILALLFIIPLTTLGKDVPEKFPRSIFQIAEIADLGDENLDFETFLSREGEFKFTEVASANSNLGFTDKNYWLKFELSNSSEKFKKLYLETGRPITDVVNLYQIRDKQVIASFESGDLIPLKLRPVNHRKILFPLELEPGETYTFYINFQSDGEVINLPLNIFDSESLIEQSYFEQLIFGGFYGLLFLAGIIYLFFYFGIREKSFLLYSFYVLSIILLHMGLDGYFYQYITPDAGWFSQRSILIFATFSAIAFGRYTQVYLNVKEYSPGIHKSFNILFILLITLMILIVTVPFGIRFYYPLVNLLGILILFHVIASLVAGYIKGKSPDIFFSLGITSFFLGFLVFILNNFSVIPNSFWTEFSSKFGTGMEVMFLSLSMANRIRLLKSEKEQMQELALEKSEESNEIKSFFLSNISHELRTPLNAIIGLSKSVQEQSKDERVKGDLEVIQYSSLGLLSAIDDILDYSRIEKKELKLDKKVFNFHKLLKEVRTNTERQALDKNLKFIYEEIGQIPKFIIGDLARTRQIFQNLLGNALKFTPEGSLKLSIETTQKANQTVSLNIKITDTGVGIPKHKLNSIFESFIQETINDKRKFGGFGLGLCIVKALVELFEGKLEIESQEGEGTTVTVLLDFNYAEPASAQEPDFLKNGVHDLSGKNILVVEDNAVNQMVMKSILKKWKNTSFDLAYNGVEALQKLKEEKFDLILMDLQMPEMDGYEATEAIRSGSAGNHHTHIPIIAVTADATDKAKNKAAAVGMDDYITKPVDREELYKKVQKCFFLQKVNISALNGDIRM
ncbi:MAG: hybrid sensor histidine kinase/response regulator [Mongoliibacter sp.]|uniref:hybrid sensor histidine kinase/response regulator n=1 Tax=Mongoliibacter sp. TaxID=2022438 RepID=UPI0012F32DD1|nr:hybrid sensor histidine kinase/response regulator [Mongoliibacter sp.]TVP49452.1 MAG: hybrid sensor histidine kinase/response regulator [Mongoliibacter sp.]